MLKLAAFWMCFHGKIISALGFLTSVTGRILKKYIKGFLKARKKFIPATGSYSKIL
jgi:hypothetical protein